MQMTNERAGIFAFAAALCLGFPAAATDDASLSETIEELVEEGFNGEILIADADRVLLHRAAGREEEAAIWPWGSVSKQVTAALVMIEVDRGTFALDDTIGRWLPGFAEASRRDVTLRQLLQHTSGLADPEAGTPEGRNPSFLTRTVGELGGLADAIGACATSSEHEIGKFRYNNCDTIVVGAILESATGHAYADLLRDRLAGPLGMRGTRMARSSERLPEGRAADASGDRINLAAYGPAGAIVGPLRDLLAFDRALMRDLVSPASRDALWRGEPALGYAALGAWSFEAPLRGCEGDVRLVERRGSVDGVQTRNLIAPQIDRVLIVVTADEAFSFGEIWMGSGHAFELASAAFCGGG